jgi:signal transduction histidine kinase
VVTHVEEAGEPVAVLVHAALLREDEALMAGATTAVRLAVGNAVMRAQVRTQLQELGSARRRIVEETDAQRRLLTSRIAAGPGQRLQRVSVLLDAVMAPPDHQGLLDSLRIDVAETQAELHAYTQGIRPGALDASGLAAALRQLADRAGLPVTVEVTPERFEPATEAALYFVCAEALGNVAKHAEATRAELRVTTEDGLITAEVVDDGVGGARADGSGLRALADGTAALGGTLAIEPGDGGGTRLRAVVPLAPAEGR